MAGQPYAVDKIAHHPGSLDSLRRREHQAPIVVHFMPELKCPHSCTWCAYGHRLPSDPASEYGWRNMGLMGDDSLPREKGLELLADWRAMGVKAIELTGGGEPLVWPHIDEWLQRVAMAGFDLAMVTNGVALTEDRSRLFAATNWKWARVSIDAGRVDDYVVAHRVGKLHWDLAWRAVERLVSIKRDQEQRVGVGFVVDHTNWTGVFDFLLLAKKSGADNVRISMAFTPAGLSRLPGAALPYVTAQIDAGRRAVECETFTINSLFSERCHNLEARAQDYEFCAVKEVVCVVGGDQRVYSCCTLAFNEAGLIGSISDRSFRALWEDMQTAAWFAAHDARDRCRVECLYEARNKRALKFMEDPAEAERARRLPVVHENFI